MIYTSTKALRYLSIPVYTIFKNLAIIFIAYGEKLVFGNKVTSLALLAFGLMVFSSIIAAWADISHALDTHADASSHVASLNAGYAWMLSNCFCNAVFVLAMRKRIKVTGFKGYDSKFYHFAVLKMSDPLFVKEEITQSALCCPRPFYRGTRRRAETRQMSKNMTFKY